MGQQAVSAQRGSADGWDRRLPGRQLQSIANAIEHLGSEPRRVRATSDLQQCSHLLLPGVGAFGFCAERLRASGLLHSVESWALRERRPLLGICVGMQLFADYSEESPGIPGLGSDRRRGEAHSGLAGVRVPHAGWNEVRFPAGLGEFAPGAGGGRTIEAWSDKARYIRGRNGMALMLTHPDYLATSELAGRYSDMLTEVADDETAWRALPGEVSDWWRRRAASRIEGEHGGWRIVGHAAADGVVTTIPPR